jgi:hypothetical protein
LEGREEIFVIFDGIGRDSPGLLRSQGCSQLLKDEKVTKWLEIDFEYIVLG